MIKMKLVKVAGIYVCAQFDAEPKKSRSISLNMFYLILDLARLNLKGLLGLGRGMHSNEWHFSQIIYN